MLHEHQWPWPLGLLFFSGNCPALTGYANDDFCFRYILVVHYYFLTHLILSCRQRILKTWYKGNSFLWETFTDAQKPPIFNCSVVFYKHFFQKFWVLWTKVQGNQYWSTNIVRLLCCCSWYSPRKSIFVYRVTQKQWLILLWIHKCEDVKRQDV